MICVNLGLPFSSTQMLNMLMKNLPLNNQIDFFHIPEKYMTTLSDQMKIQSKLQHGINPDLLTIPVSFNLRPRTEFRQRGPRLTFHNLERIRELSKIVRLPQHYIEAENKVFSLLHCASKGEIPNQTDIGDNTFTTNVPISRDIDYEKIANETTQSLIDTLLKEICFCVHELYQANMFDLITNKHSHMVESEQPFVRGQISYKDFPKNIVEFNDWIMESFLDNPETRRFFIRTDRRGNRIVVSNISK